MVGGVLQFAMMHEFVAFSVIFLCVSSGAVAAEPVRGKPKLVVFELTAERGVDDALARLLDGVLLNEASQNRALEVLGGSDLKAMLSHESQRLLLGCNDTACFAELGGALGSDFLLVPSVGRIGDYFVLNLKLLNVRRNSVVSRVSTKIDADETALFNAVAPAVRRLYADAESVPGTEAMPPVPEATVAAGPVRALTWITVGAAVLLAGGGSAAIVLAGSKADIGDDEYAAYLGATQTNRETRYGEVEDAVSKHNTMVVVGWALLGVATVAAGFAVYDLAAAEPAATSNVAISPTSGGAVLSMQGEF